MEFPKDNNPHLPSPGMPFPHYKDYVQGSDIAERIRAQQNKK